ncbi:MAG: phosphate acyltransferase PlsX [Bacteroidota bacterium]|nr:phosphate acyltransferase PlsX [Bacteroidota bacterium]
MRIGLDVMGGDYAPGVTVAGAVLARQLLPDEVTIVLIGDRTQTEDLLAKQGAGISGFEIVHASEVIEMGDHPSKAFAQKVNSSINIGFQLLQAGKIDGFASAGSTGAMMVGVMYTVKSIPGIIRPAITTPFPKQSGKSTLLLDVGLNPDCKPDVLYQYGILGSLYAEHVYGYKNPKVGLLNIGSEDEKGNLLTKAAFQAMVGTKHFNFIGNVEGNDIFDERVDVIVCDGFVGNVVLKQAEAFHELLKHRNLEDEYFARFNFENYGGTPVLGINSNVIIGHGVSNDIAIKNMILHTKGVIEANLPAKIKEFFK